MTSSIDDLDVRFQINLGPGMAVSLSGKYVADLQAIQKAIEESNGDPLNIMRGLSDNVELYERLHRAGLLIGPQPNVVRAALQNDMGAAITAKSGVLLISHLGGAYLKAAELYRAMFR